MLVLDSEIIQLKEFISQLNSLQDSVIVVEGKKDTQALKKLGCIKKIFEFHKFKDLNDFAEFAAKYQEVILLFDWDKKGRYLTKRVIKLLERRTKINLTYKRKIRQITRGKIKFIEQLGGYESELRPDAFLVKCF